MQGDGLVSIIIPVKNSEQWIGTCLQSINKQTYRNLEIIIVDNGCTDKTMAITETYQPIIVHSAGYVTAARNCGAKAANGKYLLFLDSDMELPPESVAECVSLAAFGWDFIVLPEENVACGYWMKAFSFGKVITRGMPGFEYGRFMRKDLFETIGGYDENMSSVEDRDLHLRLLGTGAKVAAISAITRHHVENLAITDIFRKTGRYTRNRDVFMQKHPEVSAGDKHEQFRLLRKRWKTFFNHPFLAAGWLLLTFLFVLRDYFVLHTKTTE